MWVIKQISNRLYYQGIHLTEFIIYYGDKQDAVRFSDEERPKWDMFLFPGEVWEKVVDDIYIPGEK